jgi:hypothetical protein
MTRLVIDGLTCKKSVQPLRAKARGRHGAGMRLSATAWRGRQSACAQGRNPTAPLGRGCRSTSKPGFAMMNSRNPERPFEGEP